MKYGKESADGTALEVYPYTFGMFQADNPSVSIRKDMSALSDWRVVPVTPRGDPPSPSNPLTKKIEAGPEVKTDGAWAETWVEVNKSLGEQTEEQKRKAASDAKAAIKADTFVQAFIAMTPAKVTEYLDANVTDLASAKRVVEKLALMLLLLAKREFED